MSPALAKEIQTSAPLENDPSMAEMGALMLYHPDWAVMEFTAKTHHDPLEGCHNRKCPLSDPVLSSRLPRRALTLLPSKSVVLAESVFPPLLHLRVPTPGSLTVPLVDQEYLIDRPPGSPESPWGPWAPVEP